VDSLLFSTAGKYDSARDRPLSIHPSFRRRGSYPHRWLLTRNAPQQYPYALRVLPKTLATRWTDRDFRSSYVSTAPVDAQASPEAYLAHVTALSRADSKAPHLKALQGLLWRTGYANGDIVTPLFPDVVGVLRTWTQQGKVLAVFSSGSVEAQRLFFGHVAVAGGRAGGGGGGKNENAVEDLNPLFGPDANFDTVNAGPKVERRSYERIAKELGARLDAVVFLSDNVNEIRAAKQAGMHAIVVDRPGNATLSEGDRDELEVIESLEQIQLS
jgi:enolase-phosphatase E1